MNRSGVSLADVRKRIDAIDDRLHGLLMERTSLARSVVEAKSGSAAPVYRPGREAEILRRLVQRHEGEFPKVPLTLIWRQIISATLGLQGDFVVAVYAADESDPRCEIAETHFGAATPLSLHGTVTGVFIALTRGDASVGVLPFPADSQETPWWPRLMQYGEGTRGGGRAAIVARLPFVPPRRLSRAGHDSLVIAMQAPEPTGRDRSFIVVRAGVDTSRARVHGAFQSRGLESRLTLTDPDEMDPEATLFLLEVDGFVENGDPRIAAIAEEIGGEEPVELRVLGAYAEPFAVSEVGSQRGVREP
ncbi:MAG: chorismate mutase [Defluviicoccus sp.]|nr:chorismate mutase [Defluviicoccus sp.]MDE0383765.1 chorismate mutase [Defluviicoccus sp.]